MKFYWNHCKIKKKLDEIFGVFEEIIERGKQLLYFDIMDDTDEIRGEYENKKISFTEYVLKLKTIAEECGIYDKKEWSEIEKYSVVENISQKIRLEEVRREAAHLLKRQEFVAKERAFVEKGNSDNFYTRLK